MTLLVAASLCACSGGADETLAQVGSSVRSTQSVIGTTALAKGATGLAPAATSTHPRGATSPTIGTTAARILPSPQAATSQTPADGERTRTTPKPTAAPKPSTLGESRPVRIQVPAIGVDSALLNLGLQDDGTMEVPPDASSLGWFTGAPTPGEIGPAVVVGHVDWAGELGSFYDLGDLVPGDEISVTREDGAVVDFQVVKRGQYSKDEFPTDAVYGNTDRAALRLITCGGEFDRNTGNYLDNIIVFADMVGQH